MAKTVYQILNFRADTFQKVNAYIQSFYDALISVAPTILTQTADSGQFTPSSLASLPADDVVYGYWIFEFDDGYSPIFIKFELSVDTDRNYNKLHVTLGTGSDGSGAITGIFFPRTLVFTDANSNISDLEQQGYAYITVRNGFLAINLWADNTKFVNCSHFFAFSRPIDMASAIVDNRLFVYAVDGSIETHALREYNTNLRRYCINTLTPATIVTDIPSDFCVVANGIETRPAGRDGSLRYVKSIGAFPNIYIDPNVIFAPPSHPNAEIYPTGPSGDPYLQTKSISDADGSVVGYIRWS